MSHKQTRKEGGGMRQLRLGFHRQNRSTLVLAELGPNRLLPASTLYCLEVQGVNNALQGISKPSQVLGVEFRYRRVVSKRTRV